ncbi:hypothetical protein VPNG_06293 [Cytospora leucostoma]|uniref:Uncharacterized protein n=1 Tax=Cytospora leucostoma TaxID=1230097 RepID=A0A423X248_9PEZI|nr:hypothetical protein VPNG_06293 [Cytospora leucostoma]
MYSSELRSTFSQELGAALRNHVNHKLAELANDDSLPTVLRNEVQRTQDMLTASYDCGIFDPTTGVHEMIVPATLILADAKQGVDTPLLILLVDFSRRRTGNTAVHLLDMYPDAMIIRVDIPYLDPKARLATIRAGNTASPYTCLYDIIIRANAAAANSFSHDGNDPSSPSSPSTFNKIHFLARNRLLLQHQKDDEESLEIPLVLLLPELTWRILLAHPAAAAAGRLSIRLRCATIRRCLNLAAVRQKNMDMLRLKSTGRKPYQGYQAAPPLGSFGTSASHGLHTLALPATLSLISSCKRTITAVEQGHNEGPAASHSGHGLGIRFGHYHGRVSGPVLAAGGFGGHHRHVANSKTLLNLGWRLARGGRY